MFLVHPDYLQRNQESQRENEGKKYLSSMWTQQRLSRRTPVLNSIGEIQKKIHKVLNNPLMKSSAKLRKYNALMTRSAVLLDKARAGSRMFIPSKPSLPSPPSSPAPSVSRSDTTPETSDSEDDSMLVTPLHSEEEKEEEEEEEEAAGAAALIPERVKQKHSAASLPQEVSMSKRDIEHMKHVIDQAVPRTYRSNVTKLYSLIARQGRGVINWNKEGEVYLKGKLLPGSDIIALLTHASKPKSTRTVPVGYQDFYNTLIRVNPSLKYVRGKVSTVQKGEGRKLTTLKWATHL